jgi:hypothetical protein
MLILQGDIFAGLIHPGVLDSPRDDWENFSGEKIELGSLTSRSENIPSPSRNHNEKRHPSPNSLEPPMTTSTFSPSQAACHMACYNEPECLQYAFSTASEECRISKIAIRGASRPGIRSGWMSNRIQDTVQQRFFTDSAGGQKKSICEDEVHWILP